LTYANLHGIGLSTADLTQSLGWLEGKRRPEVIARQEMGAGAMVRIRCGITASILLFVPSPSHGLISLVPWDSTASVADLETVAVNSPRILSSALQIVLAAPTFDGREPLQSRGGLSLARVLVCPLATAPADPAPVAH